MTISTSILDYMGKIEQSIFVLVSFVYEKKYYEGIYIYTSENIHLSVDDELEDVLGCKIESYFEYKDILRYLIKNVVPWSEIINNINEFNPESIIPITSETIVLADDIDSSEVTSATQS
jgi:hypothetical protein